MKPKQRVYAALRREPTDRIPIFMWFHPDTRTLLAELFEVPPGHVDTGAGQRRSHDLGQQQLIAWRASSTSATASGTLTPGASSG